MNRVELNGAVACGLIHVMNFFFNSQQKKISLLCDDETQVFEEYS
jgi:hypothetical protein